MTIDKLASKRVYCILTCSPIQANYVEPFSQCAKTYISDFDELQDYCNKIFVSTGTVDFDIVQKIFENFNNMSSKG